MPWKYKDRIIRVGKPWVDDNGIKHPSVWMRWTDDEKKAFGLKWEDPPASEAAFDDRFYSGRQADGTLIERSLTDVKQVDDDGNALLDDDGNQLVTLGLKSIAIRKTKQIADSLLSPYDWYVIRKTEKSTAIPTNIKNYRDAVRTKCEAIETSINNAANHAAFMALYDLPVDSNGKPTGKAPIDDWPDDI